MSYSDAASFRQALEQRLQNQAVDTGMGLARLRKRIAFEAFLRRLLIAAPRRWVLKGALALDFRLDTPTRPTKDIDLGRDDDEDAAVRDILAAQELMLDDFFTFAARRTSELDDTDDFTAIRFHLTAQLGGRTFEQFLLDIGFVDSITYTPDTVQSAGLLAFAGIAPLTLPVIPIEQHLAEKVHAYTGTYGKDGRASTRPKDLVDILLIESSAAMVAPSLHEALERTFHERQRHPLPDKLPPPPTTWTDPYRRLAESVGIEPDLTAAYARARAFLDPAMENNSKGRWDPTTKTWSATPR
ncbi:MAG: nucleotidyl transferase AbiEii/AbiGii toxin family protein [Solirubrobacteraceae bacterium]